MPDVSITLNIPSAWAARLAPFTSFRAERIEAFPETQRILTEYGAPDVASLTPKQKAMLAIVVDYLLRGLKGFEASTAADVAHNAASEDVVDNFPLDIGT